MKYGHDALKSGRHTVYVDPKLYRLTKAAAQAEGVSWSEYVEKALQSRLNYDVADQ